MVKLFFVPGLYQKRPALNVEAELTLSDDGSAAILNAINHCAYIHSVLPL